MLSPFLHIRFAPQQTNWNLAVSFVWSEATLALPLGELAAP